MKAGRLITQDADFPAEGPRAAVCRIARPDGKLLCVWNKRYGGWAWPGGKVEAGETSRAAAIREVFEETGLILDRDDVRPLYGGLHGESIESTRGSYVCVFAASFWRLAYNYATEREEGCPVTVLTIEEFLRWCIAPDFYHELYRRLAEAGQS